MTDPLEAALLPCPFCGSSAEIGEDEDGLCAVMCLNKNCYITGPSREEAGNAVSSWNRRALLAREPAVADAYRRGREDMRERAAAKAREVGGLACRNFVLTGPAGIVASIIAAIHALPAEE